MILKTYISVQLFLAAWAATVPSPTVPGIFNFTSLMDMVVNISSPTALPPSNLIEITPERTCQLRKIAECFSATAPIFYTAVINIYRRDTRLSICGIANDFDTCTVPYRQQCTASDTLSFDIFTGLIQYLCTEQGYNDYLSFVPCISNTEVTSKINKCVDNFPSPLGWEDLCRLPDNYTSCVINATRGYCDEKSAKMLRQTLMTILYPLKIATCQDRPSPTNKADRAVTGKNFTADVITILETQPSISPEPASSLEIADASVEASYPNVVSTSVFSEDFATRAPAVESISVFSEDFATRALDVASSRVFSEDFATRASAVESISVFSEDFATRAPAVESISVFSEDFATRALDVASSRVFSEDFATRASYFITSVESSSSSSTVLPVVQSTLLESSTFLPDIEMMTLDISTLGIAFVTQQAPVNEASASLTELSALQTFSQDLTTTATDLMASQRHQEGSFSTSHGLQGESVTEASQMLQEESMTIASQILQEESVTIAPQLTSEEFSTITPHVTTPLTFEFSTIKLDTQTLEDTFLTLVPGVGKSHIFSEDSSRVALDLQASSLEMSTISSHMTRHLSLEEVAITASDTSTFIKSTEAVTTDATEVLTEAFFIQPTIVVNQHEVSGELKLSTRTDQDQTVGLTTMTTGSATTLTPQELVTSSTNQEQTSVLSTTITDATTTLSSQELSTRTTDQDQSVGLTTITTGSSTMSSPQELVTSLTNQEQTSVLSTTITDATATTLLSQELLTIPLDNSVTATSTQESVDATTAASLEFSTATLPVAYTTTSSQEFSETTTVILKSIIPVGKLSTTSLEATRVLSLGEFSTILLEDRAGQVSLVPGVEPSLESAGSVSTTPLESTSLEASLGEFSTVPLVVTAVQGSLEELSTVPFEITTVQGSQGEFPTATLDGAPSEPSTENLMTELPRVNTSQRGSDEVSTLLLQMSTVQALSEQPPTTTVGLVASSLAVEDVTLSVIVPESTAILSSLNAFSPVTRLPPVQFSTVAPDILSSKVSQEKLSSSVVAEVPAEGLSSIAKDIGFTVMSSKIFATIVPDVTAIETSATATPSIATLEESTSIIELPTMSLIDATPNPEIPTMSLVDATPNPEIPTVSIDLSTSATEIPTIGNHYTTISTAEMSTIGQEITTDFQVPTQEYSSTAQEISTIVIDGTTIYPSLDNLATTGLRESVTEQTTLVEGTSIAGRDLTIPSISFDASSITQEFQTSSTSVHILSTPTADVTTTQTPSQESTTTTSVTTTVPTTTTTTIASTTFRDFQASPLNCYECHSGASGSWQNVNCPPNGRIQDWATTPRLCSGPCVSIVTRYPVGDVYRACSTNYYFPTAPPLDGCIRQDQGLFCFCSTNYCNTRDMVAEQQDYVKAANV